MKEKPVEIVKRIPTPNETPEKPHEDEIIFEEHLLYEKEHQKSNNKVVLLIFGLSVASIIGFYSFHFLETKNETIVDISTSTIAVTETKPSEKIQTIQSALEVLPVSKQEIEESIEEKKPEPIPSAIEPTQYTEALALPTLEGATQPNSGKMTTVQPKVEKIEELKKVEIVKEEEPAIIKSVEQPILVAKTPLNIIEIVHEKPMTVEEYDAQEREKAETAQQSIQETKQTFQYETIKPRYYHVRKKDTLATIAKKFYGKASDYKRIIRANRRIRSAKTSLRLGEKLLIPRKDGKKIRRYTIVEKGNTLALLAKKFYGDKTKIKKIIRANYKIKNAHSTLHIGQKVYLPQ